jgi:DNA polymerase III subunit epsilon
MHRLTVETLAYEPTWESRHQELQAIFNQAQTVLIYNAEFDVAQIAFTCDLYHVEPLQFNHQCLMRKYAQFVNKWSDYYEDYKFPKLRGANHSALGDCRAALLILAMMAADKRRDIVIRTEERQY